MFCLTEIFQKGFVCSPNNLFQWHSCRQEQERGLYQGDIGRKNVVLIFSQQGHAFSLL